MSGTPSKVRIDQVEVALLTLLANVMPAAYAATLGQSGTVSVDIRSLGESDFNEEGFLVLQPPSLRVLFAGADYNNLHDNQRLTYEAGMTFKILCFESSLRSKADERSQTLRLVDTVQDQLAGARLALADSSNTGPIELKAVDLVVGQGVVDQLFEIAILVKGIAQYSGANARFGS